MRRLTLAAAIAVLALGSAASANAQSANCRQDNRVAGTVIGSLVGATTGGVIANNVRRDSFRYNRGHRGFRRGGHGFRGDNGFRGRRGFRRSGRRGNQELGIVLGALAGGVIGNQIASNNVRNCQNFTSSNYNNGRRNQTLSGGIDHNARRLGDPYGGRRVINGQPVSAPAPAAPTRAPATPQSGVFQPVCETVFRITELPDGQRVREPVEVCQFSPGGEWIPR